MQFQSLPKGFVLAKPIAQEGYDEKVIYQLDEQGRLVITRKRDGWKLLVLITSTGEIKIYTDGINEIDSRLDHIKEEIKKLNLPGNTLIVGEAIIETWGMDEYTQIISFFHSNTDKAMAIQERIGKVKLMIFAIIPLDLESPLSWYTTFESLDIRLGSFKPGFKYIKMVQVMNCTYNEAKSIVETHGWEGLVLYDKEYQLTYRLDGKNPKRPAGCYKWKPVLEDDFIAKEKIWHQINCRSRSQGSGKVLKELVLFQIDSATGQEFECGKMGTFNNETRAKFGKKPLPFVVKLEFETRFAKTGKFRNARFIGLRTDKEVADCVSPKSYPEAIFK